MRKREGIRGHIGKRIIDVAIGKNSIVILLEDDHSLVIYPNGKVSSNIPEIVTISGADGISKLNMPK